MTEPRRRSAVRLTALMCGAETLSMTGFAGYTTLLPELQREWSLSNTEAGLISGVLFAGYMAAVPFLASITDRIDSRRVYAAACMLAFVGAGGFALFAEGVWTACLFQFLIGAGFAGTYMPGLKTLADQLEGAVQSRASGFYTASFGIGSTLSIVATGALGAQFGWQWAFAYGAIGPLVAALVVRYGMPPGHTRPSHHPTPPLLDFRPVLRNRRTLSYVLAYCAHNYELFGVRAWMVAFLAFSASLQPAEAPMLITAATIAAFINMVGPITSVSGNELAIRLGRGRVILTFMTGSGVLACLLGYTAPLPWIIVVPLMAVHYGLMMGDSAALTAGAIATAPPELRGSSMAVYSFVGFSSAFIAPLVFGVVLDVAGGNTSTLAWGLAFASMGIFGACAPIARRIARRRTFPA